MMSRFYPDYMKEYRNQDYFETEHGFITYLLIPESKTVFVGDLYVKPEMRKSHHATQLVNTVCDIGREAGMKQLVSIIYMDFAGKEVSLLSSLKYGCKIISVDPSKITVAKEL